MFRLGALLSAALLAGMLAIEATMRPAGTERMVFGVALAAAALFGFVSTPVLGWVARRARHFRTSMVLVSLSGLVAAVALAGVASAGMYASAHDLKLTIIALGTGVLLAIAQLHVLSDALSRDLGQIDSAVGSLVAGDLDARTGVERSDELGATASSIDQLADRLAHLEQAQEANDRARQELFANIGHDLRTPLSTMGVAIEALKDGMAVDPDAYMDSISKDVSHLSRMVDDLFLTARLEADAVELSIEPTDLAELADETVEALTPLADQRSVALRVAGAAPVMVLVDPAAFSRCIRNLVDNAIRHCESAVTIELGIDGSDAVLLVADDGAGFGELGEAHFDRFVRADDARERDGSGAGLGLSICRSLTLAHGGTIQITDGPGGRIEVRLPAA